MTDEELWARFKDARGRCVELAQKIAQEKLDGKNVEELMVELKALQEQRNEAYTKLPFVDRKESTPRVPIDACIQGRLYKINCRNLSLGVYDGNQGFIGIRQKFNSKFLFTEYHWDQGPPHGTVFGVVDTGIDLPEHIALTESPGTIDKSTGRWVKFDKPVDDGGKGWYFADTGEASKDIHPVGKSNTELFDWLMEQSNKPSLMQDEED